MGSIALFPAMTSAVIKKILVLAANPINTARLRLDEETREIEDSLQLARDRDQFEVHSRWAVRSDDIRRRLITVSPQIVHFSGHGSGTDGIAVEDGTGKIHLVTTDSLANLFSLFSDIECVLLNACYSEKQAQAISQHVDYVIGMSHAIGDRSAIEFAKGFYDALGGGRTYDEAYRFGCNAIDLGNLTDATVPRLWKKPGRPSPPYLVPKSQSRSTPPALNPQPPKQLPRAGVSRPTSSPQIDWIIQKNWAVLIAIILCWTLFASISVPNDPLDVLPFLIYGGISGGITGALWGWARRRINSAVQWDQVVLLAMVGIVVGIVVWSVMGLIIQKGSAAIGFGLGLVLVLLLLWDLTQPAHKRR